MVVWVLLLIVAPIIELYVIVQVATVIGVLPTVLLIVLSAVVGAWLIKLEGLGVLRRMTNTIAAGNLPADEAIDGVMIVIGGMLMVLPGFISSAIGLLLLLPPVRALCRPLVRRWARHHLGQDRLVFFSSSDGRGGAVGGFYGGGVYDVESHRRPDAPPPTDSGPRGELER
jgi:UPF0716 protein FxsA